MKKIILLCLLIPTILVAVWFKDGYILGAAEDGLIFYNISNYFRQSEFTWMEYPGLGNSSLTLIAGKPTYFFLSFLHEIGISGYLIQAVFMWFLLVSAGLGVYLLVSELFPKLPQRYIIISVFFYWFNPISLANTWNRFLLNYIVFYSLLPIGSYLFIKGLRTGKFIWAFVLNLILFFYSYAFSYVAFTILLWIWFFFVTFYFTLFNKARNFSLKYFLLNFFLFVLVNSWWVIPLFVLNLSGGTSPTANLFLKQDNSSLLDALSKSVGNLNGIFKLVNASFLSSDSLGWVKVYQSQMLYIIQYFFVGTITFFIIKLRKDRAVLFVGGLFLTVIFLAKGNNPPFGEIYNFIFKNILILQIFRNPFEKFGFLLALVSAILLSPSIYELVNKIPLRLRKLFYPTVLIVILLYLGFPLYSGLAFTNKFPPTNDYLIGYKVKVPDYYKEVDNWLISRGSNFRYIGFPIKDEGITYNWEKGYAGVELQVALFTNSGLIHTTSVPFFNQIIPEIEKTLLSDQDFSKLANLVNAKYYLLRSDIDYKVRAMTDPIIIEQALIKREKKGEIKEVAVFGKVSIWENSTWKDNTFYLAKKANNQKSFDEFKNFTQINVTEGDVLIEENNPLNIKEVINQNLEDTRQTLSYIRINPTKYILHLKNISNPTLVVFSELYNDGWQASYQDGEVLKNHLHVNVYANAWEIDRKGTYNIIIEFAPQKWMDFGEKISFLSYIIISVYLLYLLFIIRKK